MNFTAWSLLVTCLRGYATGGGGILDPFISGWRFTSVIRTAQSQKQGPQDRSTIRFIE